MQTVNLNNIQKDLLRWLVEQVRSENIDEEEFTFFWANTGLKVLEYRENQEEIP